MNGDPRDTIHAWGVPYGVQERDACYVQVQQLRALSFGAFLLYFGRMKTMAEVRQWPHLFKDIQVDNG